MKEVKRPSKPIWIFYAVIFLAILIFNTVIMPALTKSQITEVDYGTFLKMLDGKEIDTVQVQNDYIYFTTGAEDGAVFYMTTVFNDDQLVDRLYASGCEFGQVVQKQMSPILQLMLTWLLPLALFGIVGQIMSKKLMDKDGTGAFSGLPAMQFGKSNAKMYVPSTTSIKFDDVAGEDEANFVAVLACMADDDAAFRYSGALMAYVYLGNALHDTDYERWLAVYDTLNADARRDLGVHNAYWAQYKDNTATEVSDQIYETFLHTYGDDRGMRSYDACVDLLTVYYLDAVHS